MKKYFGAVLTIVCVGLLNVLVVVEARKVDELRERETAHVAYERTLRANLATCTRAKTAAEAQSAWRLQLIAENPAAVCPNWSMLSRDAQLDAAHDVGWSRASDFYNRHNTDDALRECTETLMRQRRPGSGAP